MKIKVAIQRAEELKKSRVSKELLEGLEDAAIKEIIGDAKKDFVVTYSEILALIGEIEEYRAKQKTNDTGLDSVLLCGYDSTDVKAYCDQSRVMSCVGVRGHTGSHIPKEKVDGTQP